MPKRGKRPSSSRKGTITYELGNKKGSFGQASEKGVKWAGKMENAINKVKDPKNWR